jgi:hypothetical protein
VLGLAAVVCGCCYTALGNATAGTSCACAPGSSSAHLTISNLPSKFSMTAVQLSTQSPQLM